jgi:c-di-GMP-binding flagellar brake protein YcgR
MERMLQRRKSERMSLASPLQVAVETPDGPPIPGTIRDVSEGGVGLALHPGSVFRPGDELILQVSADPTRQFLATARVIWAQPGGEGVQNLGLEWTHRGPNRERLIALVGSAAASSGQTTRGS